MIGVTRTYWLILLSHLAVIFLTSITLHLYRVEHYLQDTEAVGI
jgi:hypothetical protein